MKLIDLRTKKAKFQPIKTPTSIEFEYYRQLRAMIQLIYKSFDNIVIKEIDRTKIKELIHDENEFDKLKRLIKEFRGNVTSRFILSKLFDIALKSTNSVYNYNEINWMARLKGFGIDLQKDISYKFLKEYLQLRIESNVSLIRGLRDDVMSSLEETIYRNFEQGKTAVELSKDISNRLKIDKRRAVLIARNEIKNTNSQLNEKRMEEYGIDYAMWETAKDERVRGNPNGKYPDSKSNHWEFDKQIYKVGKGLWNEGLQKFVEPGDEINCRCVAIPLLEIKEEILKEYSKKQTEAIRV